MRHHATPIVTDLDRLDRWLRFIYGVQLLIRVCCCRKHQFPLQERHFRVLVAGARPVWLGLGVGSGRPTSHVDGSAAPVSTMDTRRAADVPSPVGLPSKAWTTGVGL